MSNRHSVFLVSTCVKVSCLAKQNKLAIKYYTELGATFLFAPFKEISFATFVSALITVTSPPALPWEQPITNL